MIHLSVPRRIISINTIDSYEPPANPSRDILRDHPAEAKKVKRSQDRILTTHVGSLVRPPELKALAQSGMDRPADAAPTGGYIETLQRATAEVVKKQAAAGLDIVSDGEFGKSSWSNYVLNRVTGFEIRPHQLRPVEWLGRDLERFADVIGREMPSVLTGRPTEACIGPIEYSDRAPIRRAIENFQTALRVGDGRRRRF